MRAIRLPRLTFLAFLALLCLLDFSRPLFAQRPGAPPVIQFFMPGGAMPERELRFTLTVGNGRIEIAFTDSKGKYSMPSNLLREGDFTIHVEGDKRTFATTVYQFRVIQSLSYVPVFLQPLPAEKLPKRTVDVAAYEANVPSEAKAAYEVAMKEVAEERVETAISEFTRALVIYPKYMRALNDLGVLYLKLNRLDEAAATFTQAISLNARLPLPRLNLGLARNRQHRYDEAVKVLYELVKDQPALGQARILLAEGLLVSKQFDEAEQQLRAGLKDETLDRNARADAHLKLGRVLTSQERHGIAAVELEKAVELEPESASAQLYLGAAYVRLRKLAEAEPALLKAYALGGKSAASAQLLLGQLYYNQQKYEPALRAFEQFLADLPTASNVPQIKEIVAKLKVMLKQ